MVYVYFDNWPFKSMRHKFKVNDRTFLIRVGEIHSTTSLGNGLYYLPYKSISYDLWIDNHPINLYWLKGTYLGMKISYSKLLNTIANINMSNIFLQSLINRNSIASNYIRGLL